MTRQLGLLAALWAGVTAAAAAQTLPAPLPSSPTAASNSWTFRVLLDGREIGSHRYTLSAADAQRRELRSEARLDVSVLRVPVYRYRHQAVESWEGGCLTQLVSHTETNGQREQVRARAQGERLVVEAAGTRREHGGCVMSFAYWDPRILRAECLLNSQTGELLPVTITSRGEETLTVRGEPRQARRHRIDGPGLRIDLWYAGDQWVGLEADTEGGRRLRYEPT